ncbi:MAG: hypothetical protein QME87_08715 [Bacillota bacterium]|nr:hypothetical protein [Bacillota bacterium]
MVEEAPGVVVSAHGYRHEREAGRMTRGAARAVDVLVFGGPVPHFLSREWIPPGKPAVHIPFDATAFLRVVMEIGRNDPARLAAVSVDTLKGAELRELVSGMDLPVQELAIREYAGWVPTEELVAFHLDCWRRWGRKGAAVTCMYSTYRVLKAEGVAVWLARPVSATVRGAVRSTLARVAGRPGRGRPGARGDPPETVAGRSVVEGQPGPVRETDPLVWRVALRCGLSAVTVGRLRRWLQGGTAYVTAEEVAAALGTSARNARRILGALLDGGFAAISGDEQVYPRGRRRVVYQLRLP